MTISLTPLARMIDNVRIKCIISFSEALRIRDKKFKQYLLENCLKSTKMTITQYVNFQIVSEEHAPEPHWSLFPQFASKQFFWKKNLKKCQNLVPAL